MEHMFERLKWQTGTLLGQKKILPEKKDKVLCRFVNEEMPALLSG
jgi:hypothetical protein